MEDAHIAEPRIYAAAPHAALLPDHAVFSVFDGHGGTLSAFYAGGNFLRVLSRQTAFLEYAQFVQEKETKTFKSPRNKEAYVNSGLELLKDALRAAFLEVDKEIACALAGTPVADANVPYHTVASSSAGVAKDDDDDEEKKAEVGASQKDDADDGGPQPPPQTDSGTTACVVVLTPEWIVCANAGDSRAVLSRNGQTAVPLSYDHKPDDDEEEKRVRAAGGFVAGGRVEGDLAVSRGFGDFRFKNMDVVMSAPSTGPEVASSVDESSPATAMKPGEQKISPVPEFIVVTRDSVKDEFFVVACDGIFDVLTNEELVQTVGGIFREGEENLGLVCEEVRK